MSRRPLTIVLALLALAALAVSGCGAGGEEKEHHAVEGEPLELGHLLYNVQITRLLNPANADDAVYLEGLEEAPDGTDYLAVFIKINNEADEPERIADSFTAIDSRDNHFEPIDLAGNPFALQFGAEVEADGQIPEPDTPAFSGPVKGSMILFLLDQSSFENRPIELEIPGSDGETGAIELDL